MKRSWCAIACLISAFQAAPLDAARVFLSPSAVAPNWQSVPVQNFPIGSSAALYVWVIPDDGETVNALSLTLEGEGVGAVNVLTHDIQNPALTDDRRRWYLMTVQDPQTLDPPPPVGTPGGALNEGSTLFRDWNAGALIPDTPIPGFTANVGLDANDSGQDPLRDPISGAFLHSQLSISGASAGPIELFLRVGAQGITAHGQLYDTAFFGDSLEPIDGGSPGASDTERDGLLTIVDLPGDTNGDGSVDLEDLNNVRNNFGSTGLGDTDGDGQVQLSDLNQVRNNFGAAVGGLSDRRQALFAVPEPAGLFLAFSGVVGIFGFFGWRGRIDLLESDE